MQKLVSSRPYQVVLLSPNPLHGCSPHPLAPSPKMERGNLVQILISEREDLMQYQ